MKRKTHTHTHTHTKDTQDTRHTHTNKTRRMGISSKYINIPIMLIELIARDSGKILLGAF